VLLSFSAILDLYFEKKNVFKYVLIYIYKKKTLYSSSINLKLSLLVSDLFLQSFFFFFFFYSDDDAELAAAIVG